MSNLNDQGLYAGEPTLQERFRRLPEALLLTAGYYASRLSMLNEFVRRLD